MRAAAFRDWWCSRFHRLSWPRGNSSLCLDCGRRIPLRVDLNQRRKEDWRKELHLVAQHWREQEAKRWHASKL